MNIGQFLSFLTAVYCSGLLYGLAGADDDPYKIIGVERDASPKQIKKAFRNLALKYHPDKNKEEGAADKFQKIARAYEVIGDPEKRKVYDMTGSYGGNDFGNVDMSSFFQQFDDVIKGFTEKMQVPKDGGSSFGGKSGSSFDFSNLFKDMGADENKMFSSFAEQLKAKMASKTKKPASTDSFEERFETHNKYDKAHNTGYHFHENKKSDKTGKKSKQPPKQPSP